MTTPPDITSIEFNEAEPLWLVKPSPKRDWQQVSTVQMVDMPRNGWPGVWDAFKAAVLRHPRFTVAQPLTLSVWIYSENQIKDAITVVSPLGVLRNPEGQACDTYIDGFLTKREVTGHDK